MSATPLLIVVALSFLAGAFGTVLVKMVLLPVVRYRRLRARVAAVLDAVEREPAHTPGTAAKPASMRALALALSECYTDRLPLWYRTRLQICREHPLKAATELMTLADSREPGRVPRRIAKIRASLRLTGSRD